jgi:hypothetical protein
MLLMAASDPKRTPPTNMYCSLRSDGFALLTPAVDTMLQTHPTHRTAVYAGAWSAPWDQWLSHHKGTQDVLATNLISLCFFAVFLVAPGYFFVIGNNTGVYSRFWFLDPQQRKAYWVISKRMFCWFAGAATFGAIWSLTLWAVLGNSLAS